MLRSEDIFDALDDDGAFAALPARLAEAFEARSCLFHWRHADGGGAVLAHSGYFSDDQMERYATEFAAVDPWAMAANRFQPPNSAILLQDLVPDSAYEQSDFFNEFVRPMGDDTFHCMGVRIANRHGEGIVAFQRGRTQSAFDREGVEALAGHLPQLRQMLTIRGQLAAAARRGARLASALDCFCDAMVIVAGCGRVLDGNKAAEDLLEAGGGLTCLGGRLRATSVDIDRALQAAIARATAPDSPEGTAVRLEEGHATLAPLATGDASRAALVSIARPATDATLTARLRAVYRLSESEADIAARLAEGASVEEIAVRRGSAVGTVRNQVKAVMARMDCRRQSEVVSRVASLPRLR